MKISPSIAVKNGLAYMALMAVACFLLGYLLFNSSQKILIKKEFNQMESNLKLLQFEFTDYIRDIQNDVLLLKDETERICRTESDWRQGRAGVTSLFEYLMEKEDDYAQIRILLSEGGGKEWVRVDRKENNLIRVEPDSLQVKGDRDYYTSTVALDSGEIYFSPIDLNKEFGKISWPKTPTLRAATPWFIHGEKKGILIINLDLRGFFNQLQSYADPNQNLFLVSSQGDYLLHPDSAMVFGFEFDQPGMAEEFLTRVKGSDNPASIGDEDVLTYLFTDTWAYPAKDYHVILGLSVEEDSILSPVYEWRKKVLRWVLMIVVFAGLIGFILMQNQRNRIQHITQLMKYPLSSDQRKLLPTNRKDEIGELAQSFSGMLEEIDHRVREVKKEREGALKATRDKEVFIENMSHELRNPLQNILGMQEVLAKNQPRQDQLPILNSMKFSARQLERLVDDVLDYAQIKEGQIQLKSEWVDITDLVDKLVKSFHHQANLKGQNLSFKFDPELTDKSFPLDPTRLSQVLGNLISNAIKYTPEKGEVTIHLEQVPSGLRFSIVDSGPGIPEEIQNEITQRFVRGKEVGNSHISGTGLGLSITVELLALMGSKLMIRERKPSGTNCSFTLPVSEESKVEKESIQPRSLRYWPGLRTALIVDDDPQIQLWYKYIFENILDECIVQSKFKPVDHQIDLIISDINLEAENMTPAMLEPSLSEGGLLIFSSGESHNPYPDYAYLRKPVDEQSIYQVWLDHWISNHLSHLTLVKMKSDYDDNPKILRRVYGVLTDQWQEMTTLVLSSIKKNEEALYRGILHKLTTTLKTLGLISLDDELHHLLQTWPPELSTEVHGVYQKLFHAIENRLNQLIHSELHVSE